MNMRGVNACPGSGWHPEQPWSPHWGQSRGLHCSVSAVREEETLMFHVKNLSLSFSSHDVNWPVWSQGRLCSWAPRAARPRPAPPSAPSDLPSWVTLHILLHFPRNKCLPRDYINHISVCVQQPCHGACPSIMGTKIRSLHQASDPLLVSFTNRRSMTVSMVDMAVYQKCWPHCLSLGSLEKCTKGLLISHGCFFPFSSNNLFALTLRNGYIFSAYIPLAVLSM